MRIVFMGTPLFSVPILEGIKDNVVLVVTQPDKKVGRKQIIKYTKIKETALKYDIPCFQPYNIRKDYQPIIDARPDIIITAAYGQMIPSKILEYPCYNIHGSLLPKYRGGAPIHRAIMNGDKETGITILKMVKKMDAGDIITKKSIPIDINDNNTILFEKLSLLGRDMLVSIIMKLIDMKSIIQDEEKVTYAYNITHEEERINWNKKGIDIYNHIRGLAMKPGAYTTYEEKKIKIYDSEFIKEVKKGNPGEIIEVNKKIGVSVLGGVLYLKIIQLEGKKMTDIKSFLNGNSQFLKRNTLFK